MTNDKNSSKTNHFLNKKKKKSSFIKNIYRILILVILLIVFYIFYNKFFIDTSAPLPVIDSGVSTNENEETTAITGEVNIQTSLTVKNAEYLKVTSVFINSDNPELSTVAAKLKNNSDQSYENVNLRITLFDENNNEITFLDYKIDKIEANGDSSTFAALARDLSDCTNFSIALFETTEQSKEQ